MAGADPSSTDLIRIDPDGAVSVAASDLWFPNGTVITPDGGTLIVGETVAARYTQFSIAADGSLGDRVGLGPDGARADASTPSSRRSPS